MSMIKETVELRRRYNKGDDTQILKDITDFFTEQKKAKRRVITISLSEEMEYDEKNKRMKYTYLRLAATKP